MKLHLKLFSLLLVLVVVGCVPVPIRNVDNAPVTLATSKQPTLTQVRESIVRAGATLGWEMKDDGSNKMIATLNLRKHVAVVEIQYSETTYSIKYLRSTNLDAKDGKIHKNYNGWIANLSKEIDVQLAGQ